MFTTKKKPYRRMFTLIELITVIVVLGILAAIVIPNVSGEKKEALTSMMNGNIRNLQTAVDQYSLKHDGATPTIQEPTMEKPQPIDMELLYPKYLTKKPDEGVLKDQKYWVDALGKVWGATVDSPSSIFQSDSSFEWSPVQEGKVEKYILYQVQKSSTTGAAYLEKMKVFKELPVGKDRYMIDSSNTQYLVSSVDEYGLESAPTGLGYDGNSQDWFTPIRKKDGTFTFELNSKKVMIFDGFEVKEEKPEGTSIEYEFAVTDSSGNMQPFIKDFDTLPSSKQLMVKVTMKRSGDKLPSLYDMKVKYHFEEDGIITPTVGFVSQVNINPTTGLPLDSSKPTSHTSHFVAPNQHQVTDIWYRESGYYYGGRTTLYYSPDGSTYTQVNSFAGLPASGHVRIEREYPAGVTPPAYQPPVVYLKPKAEVDFYEIPLNEEVQYETISTMRFFAYSSSMTNVKWTQADIKDNVPEHTRILYTYASSGGSGWSEETDSITQVPAAPSVRVSVTLQVEKGYQGKVEEPSVTSIRLFNEEGEGEVKDQEQPLNTDSDIIPAMISASQPEVRITASSEYPHIFHKAYLSFDDKEDGQGWSSSFNTGWLQATFTTPQIVTGYTLNIRDKNVSNQMPKDWIFEGYDVATKTWVKLDQKSGITNWVGKRKFFLNNTKAYGAYRINVSATNGHPYLSIGEMELLGKQLTMPMTFNGTSTYAMAPIQKVDFSQGLTIGVWANPTEIRNYARLVDFGNGAGNDNFLLSRMGTSNDLTFYLYNGTKNIGVATAQNVIEQNQWQYFTATFDMNKNMKIYKNGILVAQNTASTNLPFVERRYNFIGQSNWYAGGQDKLYKGDMKEVSIWNRALGVTEIQSMMNNGLTGNENGLVEYWKMTDRNANVLPDSSPNKLDATIIP